MLCFEILQRRALVPAALWAVRVSVCGAGAGDGGEGPGAGGRELLGDRGGEVGAPAALLAVRPRIAGCVP